MRKLFLDIETSPHQAFVWGLFDVNIGLGQLIEPSRVLCVAYQFEGEPMRFVAEWQGGGHAAMIEKVHAVLEEADMVVHYNGQSFDEKHLNREFLLVGLAPPAPFRRADLYRTVRKRFKFASSKLEHVAEQLCIRQGKIKTDFSLWRQVLAGDKKAQRKMERYNREDVALTKALYEELLPWISDHPNIALHEGKPFACTHCGSSRLQRRGTARLITGSYQRFQCRECGSWSRSSQRIDSTALRPVV
jgi:predicted RNA-binding Zn-ribbon protein involved in translation (DUF1610 family)